MFRSAALLAAAPVLALATALPAHAGGASGPAFWVDGEQYRTVGTPTDLAGTGAPDGSYDAIYAFGDAQMNVAEAKPGDTDYNGGRWQVHELVFPSGYAAALASGDVNDNGALDSTAELDLALADGTAVDTGRILKQFVCPVIKFPQA